MIVDLGCGDGRAALALAATEPGSLVVGVDPAAALMAEASRRARKSAGNAVFVAASAEAFAAELPAVADRVVLNFPWASLLRGVLGADPAVGSAIASIVKPGGLIDALVSVTPRDGVAGLESIDEGRVPSLRPSAAVELVAARRATPEEIVASRSTWGRRLLSGAGAARPVWRLCWRRC